jgi:peptidoglycan hydrolase-like protein with peptidoglycan-binding domain
VPPPDVPRCREITEGMQGVDVIAVKRALSRAGYIRWGSFTALWGAGAIAAVKHFQNEHGVPPGPGTYGPLTHAALVATHAKNSDEWAYDGYSIVLMEQSCAPHAEVSGSAVRDAIVAEARRLYAHRDEIDYSQHRKFPLQRPPSIPNQLDCSAFIAVCHFVGGAPDPNRNGYNGEGYTGTLIGTGRRCSKGELQAGDAVFYGKTTTASPSFPVGSPTHVALFDGDDGVFSQGGPNRHDRMTRHPVDYRTVNHYRHYDI